MGRLNDQIAASGTSTLVIGPRGQTAAALAARKLEAPFPVLADPGRRAYRAYGFTKSLWVIQQSGWVLIDRDGIVRHISRNTNPKNSFDEDEVLQAVKSLGS
ncbi:MAG: redoxin domain-containing protein [Gemmatimonadetes bacterium]|nr:redoxin domain-containing protein [Gemmatimonadota bacterium]